MITVTKPFFPPIEDYQKYIVKIWENQWLTNRGNLVVELEDKLKSYLGINNVIVMTNGTLPLHIALSALAKGGEVITTPFSYVATTSSIVWEKCTPIFVDIHPEYLTIDETKIEAAITPRTTTILATHVYGNPCNVEIIEEIAKKHNLKVIYDAAHCFGVTYKGTSVFNYGDVSTCSFHATKLFHTAEGGAVFSQDEELHNQMFFGHNFGHNGPHEYFGIGTNAKISELQSAMGLSVLPYMSDILDSRRRICELYDSFFDNENFTKLKIREETKWNYCYYPLIFKSEKKLLQTQQVLNENNIFPRRYFYPSLANLPYVEQKSLTITDDISSRILCLPLYYDLTLEDVEVISKLILNVNS
ncbi:DegT/DnrJ/EryC1/StrS family aminotransferase [Winogradskyella sp. MIT101101]|uniref:DegT/DnrJ/EryC1/StrS family aminotransferase n=1 Tax=Winogradskyella sp. MIT101101 TaxID=3098297 RepID=UPI00399A72E6